MAVTGSMIIAHRSPATGYELDLYAATPALSWVLILAACMSYNSTNRLDNVSVSLILTKGVPRTAGPYLNPIPALS